MILGQTPGASGPTAAQPVDFTPPAVGGGNLFKLPHGNFFSRNISAFPQMLNPVHAYPAYRPTNPNLGPQALPPITPPTPPAAAMAPAPGPLPGGTHGAFGGSGFGSSGGVRSHVHVDPYRVMRSGNIPGVSPSGSNIRAGYMNAGARVQASMPFQTAPLPPDMPPPPPPAVPGAPGAAPAAPAPAATHGFGAFSWNPFHWFRKRGHAQMVAAQAHMRGFGAACEIVGPRVDGTRVLICNGHVMMVIDAQGNVLKNAWSNPDAY